MAGQPAEGGNEPAAATAKASLEADLCVAVAPDGLKLVALTSAGEPGGKEGICGPLGLPRA